jgi:5-formyltetrahydrofolate cyclo-ligase
MASVSKPVLRKQLLAARDAVADDVRAGEARALQRHLDELAVTGSTVCAYVPVGAEPGSIEMLNGLLRRGARVLLPVARTTAADVPLALLWGEYRAGELVTGPFGLLEPARPWLPAAALVKAELIVVPALAVDRRGVRLGRGRGFYDRSLPLRDSTARVAAPVRDEELLDELPCEPHDVPMTHALTPGHGLIALC